MANDPKRTDDIDQYGGPNKEQRSDMNEERVRGGPGDDVRGVADEADEEFEETTDDLDDEDEDSEGSM